MQLQWNEPAPAETEAKTMSRHTMQWDYKLTDDKGTRDFVVKLHFMQFYDPDGAIDGALVEWVNVVDPNGWADWEWKPEFNHGLGDMIEAAVQRDYRPFLKTDFVLTVQMALNKWMEENGVAIP